MKYLVIFLVLIVFSSSISLSFSETQHTTEITSFLCGGLALEGIPNSLEEQEWVKTTLEKCVELGLITQENIEMIRNSGVHTTREVYGLFRATNGDIDKISQLVTHPNYPINVFGSPSQQVSIGIEPKNILCRENLVLVFKYDKTPACVTYQTGDKLLKRGWATCDDKISYGRGHPCGVRSSSGIVHFDSEESPPRWKHGDPEPEPYPAKCKSGPAPNGNDWFYDEKTCNWIEREWYEGDQFEKIIRYCTDPESNTTGETSSINKGGEIKLDSKNCTWLHGGFYNQAWVNQTADPVPLIQNGNVMSPEGNVIRPIK